jgi:RNA polymerase sigma-70 factor, ECF subfamily
MSADDSLLQRLKAGEAAAYEWLVREFEGPLFRYFVCEHRDFHLAQEQTSETFVQLVRSIPSMKGSFQQLRAFVFSIARHMKSRHWRQSRFSTQPLPETDEICDPRPSPQAVTGSREQLDLVLLTIGQFEPTVRDVLLLRFVEGFSLEEVAGLVDLPLGTVKSHIHRGVTRLKKLLTDSGCRHD